MTVRSLLDRLGGHEIGRYYLFTFEAICRYTVYTR